jgi:hypothetical protein
LNIAPTVAITSPTSGASYSAPTSVSISANATDAGTISKVEFFANGSLLGTDTNSPYTFIWNGVPAGVYTLTARATDNQGGTGFSSAISITVTPSGTNNFVLLDSFENANLADLNGQNSWTAANARVTVDPTQSTNKVASFDG